MIGLPFEIGNTFRMTTRAGFRKMSDAGRAIVKHTEGLKLKAYRDPGRGIPTIAWGCTKISGQPVTLDMIINLPVAEALLSADLESAERDVDAELQRIDGEYTQGQFDALVDFVYNLGLTNFLNSTLWIKISTGEEIEPHHFTDWNKARDRKTGKLKVLAGLTKRRQWEYALYTGAPLPRAQQSVLKSYARQLATRTTRSR